MELKSLPAFIVGACLAIGLALAGFFVSQTMLNARTGVNTATVKGLAERVVDADELRWDFSVFASDSVPYVDGAPSRSISREALYERTNRYKADLIEKLKEVGFTDDMISTSTLEYWTRTQTDNDSVPYELRAGMTSDISVRSDQFELVRLMQEELEKFTVEGAGISAQSPRYLFTDLNAIKPDMLKEATQNARIAADEFAKNADVQVGGIQNAAQGGFSVRDLGDDGSEYYDPQKLVRVVTTITFYLEN